MVKQPATPAPTQCPGKQASGVEDLRHHANACIEREQQKAIDTGVADQYGTQVVKDAALVRCAAIINEASAAQKH